jgi:small-conductance mechanosensitive channel
VRSLDGRELQELLRLLAQPTALTEAGVLGGCLVAAWLAVRLIRGRTRPIASVWFGERIVDGVLFPVLALAFAFAARLALQSLLTPAVFRLAIPILISLVLIRLSARVLRATFPATPWVRRLERSISWAAWIAVVLWITGIGPLLLDAMGDVSWQFGTVSVTLRSLIGGVLTVGVVLVLVLWVSAAIERRLLVGTGANLSLRKMAASIVRALMVFIGLMVALSAVGIDLTAFFPYLAARSASASASACRRSRPTTSAASSSWPSGACASATW